jgi:cellulose synthase/poly-beta-1,6-N-acetylglucosamine synthase-like glycosyltransferase
LSLFSENELPHQIMQLPVYNESINIVKQLIESAANVSYPRERLMIQLLDDSDRAEISNRLRNLVFEIKKRHPDLALYYLHRKGREGYKAGNLNFGLISSKQILRERGVIDTNKIIFSIFDADFIIPSDYLINTVHYFTAPEIGAVQATLKYYNYNLNPFTRAQASFLINLHQIEFGARSRSGHLTTYRGSAGSWRLSAIESCGGWQGDTQIEDVDLSIGAQLLGWKILYLNHLTAYCQLPTSLREFKLQQRSWMKGLMEVFRKKRGLILKSTKLSLGQKILAMDFFLILSLQPLFIIISHLSIIPSYYYLKRLGSSEWVTWIALGLLMLLSGTHLSFLSTGLKRYRKGTQSWWGFVRDKCIAIALVPALFVTLAYGLIEGFRGVRIYRDRTIKDDPSGINQPSGPAETQHKILVRINRFEIAMGLYSIVMVSWAFWQGETLVGLIFGMLTACYLWNAMASNIKPISKKYPDP